MLIRLTTAAAGIGAAGLIAFSQSPTIAETAPLANPAINIGAPQADREQRRRRFLRRGKPGFVIHRLGYLSPSPRRKLGLKSTLQCAIQPDWDEGQSGQLYPILRITNTTNKTIPAGAVVHHQMNTGHTGQFTVYNAIAPGANGSAIDVTPKKYESWMTCAASVFVAA